MKSFCPHCGTLINYVGKKPNFCSSCGQSLNTMVAQTKETSSNIEIEAEFEEEEQIEAEPLPNLNKLEIDIQVYSNKQTLGSVMQSSSQSEANSSVDDFKAPNQSQQDFLKQFQKEAGTQRQK
jgi:uncharacterized Zn finger protein (UPF0148 family)